jgi:hypothetical protein
MPSNHARWLQSLLAVSRRAARPSLIALAGFGMASTATAGNCWDDFWATYRANQAWPAPYVYLDRATVTPMLVTMVENGTERQNTLSDYHFNENGTKLTRAGLVKVRWILFESPGENHAIWVERGFTDQETRARIDTAQQAAVAMMPEGNLPPVQVTNQAPYSRPSMEVDATTRKYYESMPAPRLPASVDGTGPSASAQ